MREEINLLWIAIAYLIGSIPSGYLITLFSAKKNILKIGWKKTSGSNVFKNIGAWQGLLTAITDIGKGYLAVKLAQELGYSSLTQVFAGIAVITGNNWSLFLKFSGGRGVGTYLGAGLAFSPIIMGLALLFPLFVIVVWDTSIATILFLFNVMIFPCFMGIPKTLGLFGIISFLPVFLKRLSPIKEIFISKDKLSLTVNRLLFDEDVFHSRPRIQRIMDKLTKK